MKASVNSAVLSVCLSVDHKARNEYKHEYVKRHEYYYKYKSEYDGAERRKLS